MLTFSLVARFMEQLGLFCLNVEFRTELQNSLSIKRSTDSTFQGRLSSARAAIIACKLGLLLERTVAD